MIPSLGIISLNWDLLISVFAICLTGFATFIKIYSGGVKENRPGNSPRCKEMSEKISDIIDDAEISSEKNLEFQKEIDRKIAELQKEVAVLISEVHSHDKTLEELRKNIHDAVKKNR